MSTEQMSVAPMLEAMKQSEAHPLCPITSSEITRSAELIKRCWPSKTSFHFKAITLEEPAKTELVPYLDAEHKGSRLPRIDRRAFVSYYIRNTDKLHEAIVNLTRQKVESNVKLGPNVHGPGDWEEILTVENVALQDESVKAEIAKLGLPEGTAIVSDPWIYGSDGVDDDRRMYQCFLYMRDPNDPSNEDSNHYAFPLAISPVVDVETLKVSRIDLLPTGADHQTKATQPLAVKAPNEYTPEHHQLRTDLKPLNVVQPEGASFKVIQSGETGEIIEWQKWSFRVGFNQREGMVLYDVRYAGRSLFYRLALSDLNIPYADPRHPFHKKAAFDLGDAGAGTMANNLKLGCDCLGSIHYLSAVLADDNGKPLPMNNVVCIHEQDAGIGWKHTNYRTGRAALVRSRELVIQSIITVANYEYIMAFMFNQAGDLTYEVRATGVVSTQPIDEGVDVPWGTIVHPGVLAVHHQHIFSLRIDPAIDGHSNTLIYEEVHPMSRSEFNPHGVGYNVEETVVRTSGGLDTDYNSNRVYKIQNESSRNPINGKAVAYKVHAPAFQKMLADPNSYHHKRAEFADHNIYVTRYRDGELYAGGKYTNQSRGGSGVRAWANRKENVVNDDIVVWVQFGLQHVTRIEDFPVMPCEVIKVQLKPVNFFDKNPALDVPPSSQEFNRSTDISEQHKQPSVEAKIGQDGACCAVTLRSGLDTHNELTAFSYVNDLSDIPALNLKEGNLYIKGKRAASLSTIASVGFANIKPPQDPIYKCIISIGEVWLFEEGYWSFKNQGLPAASQTMAAAPDLSASPSGEVMNTAGVSSLRGELETQTSLDEDLEEQERQRWIEDGKQMWRQELGKRHLPDDFSDPAPHLTDLEKHRNRVRRDENREGTKIWDRNQMSSKEKESEGQGSRSRHGDRLSFESYDGGQNIPASTSNEEVRQQRPNSPTVQAREAGKQRRTGVLRGGHLETTNLAEARETTNVPKVEKETRLIRTPGVLTVEQAEMYARLASVGLRPKFVAPPAPVSQPASKESSFRYLGYHYTDEGDIILPFPIKRNMEGAPMMSVDGLVHPCAARPHEKESTAAESASMSQMGGARTGDMRERGGATRGKSGMVRGGKSTRGRASTRGGGAARGGCQTALPQQAPRGQFQRSSHLQGPSTLPMHDPSVMTGEDSHHVHSQMGEMERPPIDRVPQPLGPINGYVHSDGISQCRPSGFMPIPRSIPPPYAIPGKHLAGPQQQRPNLGQDQEDITISSMGPIPGTSYKFPSLEGDLIITEDRGHQRPFPNQAQQPPVVISISNSRMELPPPLFPYGQGRHGEYNMQTYMPPAAERDPQDSLPTPSQGPATMPRATPHLAESGAQQPLPTASQEPAMPPSAGSCSRQQIPTSPQRAQFLPRPATWPWVQPPHHEGRDGSQSGQVGQTVVQPLEEERASLPVQHSQPAIPGTAVIDFAPVAQNRPS